MSDEDSIRFAVYTGGHGHELPDPDGAREPVTYSDGCMVTPLDDGSWVMTPVIERPPVADTGGIDAAREELRMALRGAVTDLPQPTLGKAGGVNRGAVIDAIDRVFAAALRTPKPEGETE